MKGPKSPNIILEVNYFEQKVIYFSGFLICPAAHFNVLSESSPALLDLDSSMVSFADVKEVVRKKLHETNMVRQLILSEPDFLPRDSGLSKLLIYSKMLRKERFSS